MFFFEKKNQKTFPTMSFQALSAAPRGEKFFASFFQKRSASFLETLYAFVLVILFYFLLYGDLPYHDVPRFVGQVESGRFVFDIAHVFLQPATLLWHRFLGFGESAELSQKHINTVATALAVAVFVATLGRLGVPRWQRMFAAALVATSCSVITLAPSGHMKLVAFPFVNAALYTGLVWEQRRIGPGSGGRPWLVAAGLLLALASAFLVSCLAVAPFASLAVVIRSRHAGNTWRGALADGLCFALPCGVAFALMVCWAFVTFSGAPLSLAGLVGAVADKEGLRAGARSPAEAVGRLAFGIGNNLIAAPLIGSVIRSWVAGYIPSLRPYARDLAIEVAPWAATLALLAVIYLRAITVAVVRRAGLMALAFLLGALTWSGYYSLNDPEHWFQQTVPTVVLFLTLFSPAVTRTVLPVWALITAAINLTIIALPQATYPLYRYEQALRGQFSDRDLIIDFAAYPGGHYSGFLVLPGVPRLRLDMAFLDSPDRASFARMVQARIEATWRAGGQVVVFGALDPESWDAPWPVLMSRGLTKDGLRQILGADARIGPETDIAEIKTWRLTPMSQ
jgi:hypothetical protein